MTEEKYFNEDQPLLTINETEVKQDVETEYFDKDNLCTE